MLLRHLDRPDAPHNPSRLSYAPNLTDTPPPPPQTVKMIKAIALFTALAATAPLASAMPDRPVIDKRARVKQHRAGAQGDLVSGEEHLRKIIVYWQPMPNALSYEICHNCHVNDDTGERRDEDVGFVYPVNLEDTCAGNMCYVFKGVPLGKNRFNVRVKTADEWSGWSEHANFEVDEPGFPDHEHHEL